MQEMANKEEDKGQSKDFYQVLGLNKECTHSELRNAYKKLALRWHPDRFSASENSKLKLAKENFQAVQQAYSVLSDANKRFLYDVGAYNSDDDENGMGEFLNEMATMMSQTKSNNEDGEESFEELQVLFEEMFDDERESLGGSCHGHLATTSTSSYDISESQTESCSTTISLEMHCDQSHNNSSALTSHSHRFSTGVGHQQSFKKGKGSRGGVQGGRRGGRRRQGRKQNVSYGLDGSSQDHGISAS